MAGSAGVPYPIIPGHVSAGTLERIRGPLHALDGSVLHEGDRVAFFDVHRTCGRCRACTVHRTPTRCTARRVYGITDPASEGLYGGWSQGIYLEPGVGIARLPDSVTFDDYIGGGCGLLTAVHILERAAVRPGDTVLVQGTGAVGLSAIALSRTGGAATVIAVGAPADRLDLARRMGADHVFDVTATTREQRLEGVHALTHGEGADVVLEAAGAAAAVPEGLDLARDGGRYVIAGHYTDAGDVLINAHRQINRKHLEIRGMLGERARSLRPRAVTPRALRAAFSVARNWRAHLLAPAPERSARRRRSHADHEGTRGPVARLMRQTKIIATLGPASSPPEVIDALLGAGVDIFRLNFSHGSHESHAEVYQRVRDAAARRGCVVAIMQDLSGPKIRTGPLAAGATLTLREGEELRIAEGDEPGREGLIFTPYGELVRSAKPGDRLLLDDGRIELRVIDAGEQLTTVVVNGGALGGKKGINAPGVLLPSSALTAKDEADLRFGLRARCRLCRPQFRSDRRRRVAGARSHGSGRHARADHRQDRAPGGAPGTRRDPGGRAGSHGRAW